MIGTLGYPSLLPVGGFGDSGPEHTLTHHEIHNFCQEQIKSVLRGCATSHGLSKICAWLKVMINSTVSLEVVPGLRHKRHGHKIHIVFSPSYSCNSYKYNVQFQP